jgi:O-antigen/teichoic acid export membrane protein
MWSHHFDLGLGTGLKYKLTEAIANGDIKRSKHLVSTAYASISIIMGLALVVLIPVVLNINWCSLLNASIELCNEITYCILSILIVFALQFILELITIVLKSYQRTAISEVFKPISNIISLVIIIILGFFSHDSLIFASLAMIVPYLIVLLIANIWYFTKQYKDISPTFSYIHKKYISDIYSLGLKYFVNQFSALVVFSTANFLLSHTIGPSEVSIYSTANTYYNIIVIFFTAIIVASSTPITDAFVRSDIPWIKGCMRKLFIIATIAIALELILFAISGFAFRIWVGDKIIVPTPLAIAFVVYNILALFSQQYGLFLASVGKMNLNVIISCCKIVLFIPVAVYFVKSFGAIGLVLATIIINTIPNLLLGYIQTNKIISGTATGIWNK